VRDRAGGEAREKNAVGQIAHARRVKSPDLRRDPPQGLRGHRHRRAAQREAAQPHAARDLSGAFLRAETVLDMHMRAAGQKIGHRPLDGAEIVGDQQVRRPRAQRKPEAPDVAERLSLPNFYRRKPDGDIGRQAFSAGKISVHGDDVVVPAGAQPVGDGAETHLRAADRERRKNVQQSSSHCLMRK